MRADVLRQLEQIDWDFTKDTESHASGTHWYPGTFVASIPGTLTEALTEQGDWVFDPFCGVGTTGISAMIRGRNVFLADSNPVALLAAFSGASLGILALLDPRLLLLGFDLLDRVVNDPDGTETLPLRADGEVEKINSLVLQQVTKESIDPNAFLAKPPNKEALETWFETETLHSFLTLRENLLDAFPDGPMACISLAMLSASARQLCSQTQSWGHIADNVRPRELTKKDVVKAARLWIKRTKTKYVNISKLSPPLVKPKFKIQNIDWSRPIEHLNGLKSTCLITSPPYAGAIDYTLAQRLSLYLLGYEEEQFQSLVAREIGARRKRSKSLHVSKWAEQIVASTQSQISFLEGSATMAFVLPHKDSGREIGETALSDYLTDNGWELVLRKDRSIRQARTRQSWTSIKKETILIFER